jgi:hypothetical protein
MEEDSKYDTPFPRSQFNRNETESARAQRRKQMEVFATNFQSSPVYDPKLGEISDKCKDRAASVKQDIRNTKITTLTECMFLYLYIIEFSLGF